MFVLARGMSFRAAFFAVATLCTATSIARAGSVADAFAGNPANPDVGVQGAGGWSYGYYSNYSLSSTSASGTFTSATFRQFLTRTTAVPYPGGTYPGLVEWKVDNNASGGTDPNVIYNTGSTGLSTDPNFGDIIFPSKTVTLGPWLGPSVVRYTVPTNAAPTATYDISASFNTVQIANGFPTAYVIFGLNDSPGPPLQVHQLLSGTDPQYGESYKPFDNTPEALTAGETIDFVVFGNNTNNKTTALVASVTSDGSITGTSFTPVPLPPAAWCGLGLFGAIGVYRLKRFRAESPF